MPVENPIYYSIIYISFFISTGFFSFLLNGLFLKFARTLGIRNRDETMIRWSDQVKPALGGIAFYIIFLFSIASYNIFFETTILLNKQVLGLLAATALAFLVGLSDDAYNTKPLLKLFAQFACGMILISTGTYISLFESEPLNYSLTILWVVAVMNSINMLDNMDAIATMTSIFIILSALLTIYLHNDYSHVYMLSLIGVLAALLGFLFYNWHPAKVYMGDTGSQFLGIYLAAIGITYFWNNKEFGGTEIPTKQIIITILAFIVPIIDTGTVVINRISKGQSPFIGGKDHTTHHLSYLGFSDRQVALIFTGFSLISFILIFIIIKFISNWGYAYAGVFFGYFLILFIIIFRTTKLKRAKEKLNEQEQFYAKKDTKS